MPWEWNQIRYAGCQVNAPDRNGEFFPITRMQPAKLWCHLWKFKVARWLLDSKSSPFLSLWPGLEMSIVENSGPEIKTLHGECRNLKDVNCYICSLPPLYLGRGSGLLYCLLQHFSMVFHCNSYIGFWDTVQFLVTMPKNVRRRRFSTLKGLKKMNNSWFWQLQVGHLRIVSGHLVLL